MEVIDRYIALLEEQAEKSCRCTKNIRCYPCRVRAVLLETLDATILAAAPRLLEGCKKALTCGNLNSDVREFIVSVIVDAKAKK